MEDNDLLLKDIVCKNDCRKVRLKLLENLLDIHSKIDVSDDSTILNEITELILRLNKELEYDLDDNNFNKKIKATKYNSC